MNASAQFEETRRIILRRYEVSARIGIHDFEQAGPQRLWVSVELWLAPRPAPRGDEIGEVLDYDFLREEIARLAASRHFNLQETFAEALMELCLGREGVTGALVRTEKPDVYPDTEAVGFELTRFKVG